jgi:formate dehydrogenase major subunit
MLEGVIGMVKAITPEIGYGPILELSETEAVMRNARVKRIKTVCTYCGLGCSFDIWTGGVGGDRPGPARAVIFVNFFCARLARVP